MSVTSLLALLLCLNLPATLARVTLKSNGYEGLVIGINEEVEESEELITKIEEMMTKASQYLYNATNQRAFFRQINILIPKGWSRRPEYLNRRGESYGQADIRIDIPDVLMGHGPYTFQFGQCGVQGDFIHFTPEFILDDELQNYFGARERVLVHEWGHYWWGLFDEYGVEEKFYISSMGKLELIRCNLDIAWNMESCRKDTETGLPDEHCYFAYDNVQTSTSSVMSQQYLPSIVKFCDKTSHNTEAPNLQNKYCNHQSTWDVMMKSEDFKNDTNSPVTVTSTLPTFIYLYSSKPVFCLVLDTSASMKKENRLQRLRQAVEAYIMQMQYGDKIGIVTFNSIPHIQSDLVEIRNKNSRVKLLSRLPTTAERGTVICSGIQLALKVVSQDDGQTRGDELVLMTDGKDERISMCFKAVKKSGVVIHTIALGSSADKNLEKLSTITNGRRFFASDKVESNSVIDSFISSASKREEVKLKPIQLESAGMQLGMNDWLNGTVYVDRTVGTNTEFVVSWRNQKPPNIRITNPKGIHYGIHDFVVDESFKTARLQLQGRREVGAWHYAVHNADTSEDQVSITVTSHSWDSSIVPITVDAHMDGEKNSWPQPMIAYARVMQKYRPVIGANVLAKIEDEHGSVVSLQLLDNGAGADLLKDDGIYTRYFTNFSKTGRHNLKVFVKGEEGSSKISSRRGFGSEFIPSKEKDGVRRNISSAPVFTSTGDFSRTQSGESFIISIPPGAPTDIFPPNRIIDLNASEQKIGLVELTWTAPGDNADSGQASRYRLKVSTTMPELLDASAKSIITEEDMEGNLDSPSPAGHFERILLNISKDESLPEVMYFAMWAYDETNLESEMSNMARVYPASISKAEVNFAARDEGTVIVPKLEKDKIPLKIIVSIAFGCFILACILVGLTLACVFCKRKSSTVV
uniref:calcium-activated chloride channel regulator 3A-1-like isoform X2 n=1 Tax=Myxine glutinosa TaxID=7769 RepID=UPI00358E1A79